MEDESASRRPPHKEGQIQFQFDMNFGRHPRQLSTAGEVITLFFCGDYFFESGERFSVFVECERRLEQEKATGVKIQVFLFLMLL